jgi:predicted acyl esterase
MEEMYRRSNVSSPFWEDKRVDMTKIKCPAYIRGSDVSSIHTMGSIRGFLEIPHNDKWIHWGSYQEWYELYSVPHSADELQVFFDHYLKHKKTDWLQRPKVRWSALQFGDREAIEDIVLEDFPVPSTKYEKFYLSEGKLLQIPVSTVSKSSYDSEKHESFAEFVYTFPKAERLIGLPKAVLHMSCDDRDDFTTFVILRKKDKNGKDLMHLNFPFSATPVKSIDEIPLKDQASLNLHLGSIGILRASHRAIDSTRSIHPQFPFHPHKKQEKVPPGTIVKLEIGIWAMGVDFDAGESISIRVSLLPFYGYPKY